MSELQKNADTFEDRRTIMEFLEFISSDDRAICAVVDEDRFEDRWAPITENQEHLLDRYFSIDSAKLEKERRALISDEN